MNDYVMSYLCQSSNKSGIKAFVKKDTSCNTCAKKRRLQLKPYIYFDNLELVCGCLTTSGREVEDYL